MSQTLLRPLPAEVAGVDHPIIDLGGKWRCTLDTLLALWANAVDPAGWPEIEVPGEAVMQGFKVERDKEFAYKRPVHIPAEFASHRFFLRMVP